VSEAEAAGVKLMVSQNARLLYGLPPLVELIRSGELGEITAGLMVKTSEHQSCCLNCYVDLLSYCAYMCSPPVHRATVHNSGVDDHAYLWEHGIHDFDSMRFVFGSEPKRLFCDSYNPPWSPYKGGAGTMSWVEFESGARCQFYCSFMTPNNGSRTALETLTGGIYWRLDFQKGTAEYTHGSWKIHRPGQDEPEDTGFSDKTGIPGTSGAVSSAESVLLSLFHDYVFKGLEPEQSGRKNLNTVGLITALGRSSELGRPIEFTDYLADHLNVFEEVTEVARL
jgi:predicted dehydrogenase